LLSAVAEFERELIRERVRSGLANARARGKRLGRPNATPRLVNKGLSLIRQGMTFEHAAEQSGVSVSTLLRARRKGNDSPPDSRKSRSVAPAPGMARSRYPPGHPHADAPNSSLRRVFRNTLASASCAPRQLHHNQMALVRCGADVWTTLQRSQPMTLDGRQYAFAKSAGKLPSRIPRSGLFSVHRTGAIGQDAPFG
jgi:hypothetical protein